MDLRQYVRTWLRLLLRRKLQRAVGAELALMAAAEANTVFKLMVAFELILTTKAEEIVVAESAAKVAQMAEVTVKVHEMAAAKTEVRQI